MPKLILLDGNSLISRFFYALPLLMNSNGLHTNSIYGFSKLLLKLLREESPTHMLVAFDAGRQVFRHEQYSEYKGGRTSTPNELSEQFPYIYELLEAFGIPSMQLANYEADDIIGTLAHAKDNQFETLIISGDRDLLQLVDERVNMLYVSGKSNYVLYDLAKIDEDYGLGPSQIIDLKGLMGDSSDNIPGVPGVGNKTATKLLQTYQSLENVLSNVEQISGPKLRDNLNTYREQAVLSKSLATIFLEAPVEISFESLALSELDPGKINSLFRSLEFKTLLIQEQSDLDDAEDNLLDLEDNLDELSLFLENERLAIYLSDTDLVITDLQKKFAISLDRLHDFKVIIDWLVNPTKEKILYDLKAHFRRLKSLGIHLEGVSFDVLLAAYLLDPSTSDLSLDALGSQFLVERYSSYNQPEVILSLYPILLEKIKKNSMLQLLTELEMPLSIVLGQLELDGIMIDTEMLAQIGLHLEKKLGLLKEEIYSLAGEEFNIGSPKQLSVILFEKLGLPTGKKGKTGYSTSADILERLASKHEIVAKILDYRQVSKLLSTYVEGLSKEIAPDGKIHTTLHQTITATGRLSSSDPNLQNIPVRTEEGRELRKIFIASKPSWSILTADYSQIELRILAHLSQDTNLLQAFADDRDIHSETAMKMFGLTSDQLTPDIRFKAKAINFGIVYGISDYGLSQNLNISRKEAADFIEKYFTAYPGVKLHMDNMIRQGQQNGYVKTLLNRRRYIPDINSRDFNKRGFAERVAINMPIQGTQADIIKKAMIDISEEMKRLNLRSRMLLQVHDELLFEVAPDELDLLAQLVRFKMENVLVLSVAIKVDLHWGKSWFDAK